MGWHRGLVVGATPLDLYRPYLLWDTRYWEGGTAPLRNRGRAGSKFNLPYYEDDVTTFNSTPSTMGVKHRGFRASGISMNISELGGEYCGGEGAFTVVKVYNLSQPPTGANVMWGMESGSGFVDQHKIRGYHQMNVVGDNTLQFDGDLAYQQSLSTDEITTSVRGSNVLELSAGYLRANPAATWAGSSFPVVVVMVYENSTPTRMYINGSSYSSWTSSGLATCYPIDDAVFDGVFSDLMTLQSPTPGHYWYGLAALGLYRGVPTTDDLTAIQTQFGSGTYQPSPFMRFIAGDTKTLTVPTRSAPYAITALRFTVLGAMGGNSYSRMAGYFEVDAVGGDVFQVIGGRRGGGFGIGGGAGGFPDGGAGGGNTHFAGTPWRGGGGGGSTKIYKNGNLIAQIGGGGGGAGIWSPSGGLGIPISTRPGPSCPQITAVDGNAPALPIDGGGGQTSVPAVGTAGVGSVAGSSPGSGSDGGDGFFFHPAGAQEPTGTGGGGGGFRGGGSGAYNFTGGSPAPYEAGVGGGGSNWFDTSEVYNQTQALITEQQISTVSSHIIVQEKI